MCSCTFKERVKNIAIACSVRYRDVFCKYEYVIISEAFTDKYYVIRAETDNYMHLIGISSDLSPQEFYKRCINKTLRIEDFSFIKNNQSEKSVKGSVREKIIALPHFCEMFNNDDIVCQQDYIKGKVRCSFASATDKFTVGFVKTGRPMTLMKSNQLEKSQPIIAVIRKLKNSDLFTEVIYGSVEGYEDVIRKINI